MSQKKLIHFIWIGQKPYYLDYVLSAYKTLNDDCQISLLHYTINQLQNLFFNKHIEVEQDKIVFNLLNDIIFNNKYHELIDILITGKEHINYSNTPFIQLFCDILRLELLNIYGGIYVDCDTFPLKPFDEALFNHEKFLVYDKISDTLVPNNYFIGLRKGAFWNNYFDGQCTKIVQYNNQQFIRFNSKKSFDFMVRRIKFFKCRLSLDDFKDINTTDYFEHYSEFRWGLGKVELTKFDDIFDRQKYFR